MDEERSPKSIKAPESLIDNLRGDVINCIVERLPIRDAAKMCVLSHKWRDAWITIPQLVFDAVFFATVVLKSGHYSSHLDNRFHRIVSNIFFLHDGPILKFSLIIPPVFQLHPDISQWLSFLSKSGVRDICLQNYSDSFIVKLSKHLFSCVDLESLNLLHCELSRPPNSMGFRKLKSLELVKVTFQEGTFEHIIASCPLLERLCLKHCKGFEHVDINTPNLKQLIVVGTFKSFHARNVGNIVFASIALEEVTSITRKFIEVFAKSTKLEKLRFGGRFCKVLFNNDRQAHPVFDNLRTLELSSLHLDDPDVFSYAIKAIQSCPNIEILCLSVTRVAYMDKQSLAYNLSIKFLQLRNITAILQGGLDVELKVVEFLLACSPKLELMSIEIKFEVDMHTRSRISRNLTQVYKASPNVTLMIYVCGSKDGISVIDSATDGSSDAYSGSDSEYSDDN